MVWTWLGFVCLAGDGFVGCEVKVVEVGGCTSKLVDVAKSARGWLSGPGIATLWKRGIVQWRRLADAGSCKEDEDYDKHQLSVIERMSSLQEVGGRRVVIEGKAEAGGQRRQGRKVVARAERKALLAVAKGQVMWCSKGALNKDASDGKSVV